MGNFKVIEKWESSGWVVLEAKHFSSNSRAGNRTWVTYQADFPNYRMLFILLISQSLDLPGLVASLCSPYGRPYGLHLWRCEAGLRIDLFPLTPNSGYNPIDSDPVASGRFNWEKGVIRKGFGYMRRWRFLILFSLGLLLVINCRVSWDSRPLTDREIVSEIFGSNATVEYNDQDRVTSITCPTHIKSPLTQQIVTILGLSTACRIQDKETLPPEIGQLTELKRLELRHGSLTALPPEIGNLTTLEALLLDFNDLANLPPEIGKLINLRGLGLQENDLTTLPSEIGQLTKLKGFNLAGNNLTGLPPEMGQLTSLESLILASNRLTALPSQIGQLRNLQTLIIDDNALTTLPPEIGQLTNLELLRAYGNDFTTVPQAIEALKAQGVDVLY